MMSADTWALILVVGTALAINPFWFLYTFTSPWYRMLTGRAIWVSSGSLMLLVDIALLYNWLGDDYAFRDVVRLTVYALICCGAWLKLIALLRERLRTRQGKVDRFR